MCRLDSCCRVDKRLRSSASFNHRRDKECIYIAVKFQKQEPNKCGVAALSSVPDYFGIAYSGIENIYNSEGR